MKVNDVLGYLGKSGKEDLIGYIKSKLSKFDLPNSVKGIGTEDEEELKELGIVFFCDTFDYKEICNVVGFNKDEGIIFIKLWENNLCSTIPIYLVDLELHSLVDLALVLK